MKKHITFNSQAQRIKNTFKKTVKLIIKFTICLLFIQHDVFIYYSG